MPKHTLASSQLIALVLETFNIGMHRQASDLGGKIIFDRNIHYFIRWHLATHPHETHEQPEPTHVAHLVSYMGSLAGGRPYLPSETS
jgi:hypothetical protein